MTIRFKLTMAAIAVILVANSVVSLIGVEYAGRIWLREVQTRVRLDLNSARAAYDNHVQCIADFLEAVSLDRGFATALSRDNAVELESLLKKVHRTGGMDFVSVLNAQGRVIRRAWNPDSSNDDLADNPIISKLLKTRKPASGTIVLTQASLELEGRELAGRARFELLPTPAARRDGRIVPGNRRYGRCAGRTRGTVEVGHTSANRAK